MLQKHFTIHWVNDILKGNLLTDVITKSIASRFINNYVCEPSIHPGPAHQTDRQEQSTGRSIWSRTWVGLTMILTVPPPCPAAVPILPVSHLPQQNAADSGTAKNKVNPTPVRDLMPHPVFQCFQRDLLFPFMYSILCKPFCTICLQDVPCPCRHWLG